MTAPASNTDRFTFDPDDFAVDPAEEKADPYLGLEVKEARGAITDFADATLLILAAAGRSATRDWRDGRLDDEGRRALCHAVSEYAAVALRAIGEGLAADLQEKALADAIGRAFSAMGRTIRTGALAATLALRGPEELAAEDRAAFSRAVAGQEVYLKAFEAAVRDGSQPPDGTLGARAAMYGHAAWSVAWDVARSDALAGGMTEEASILGAAEHCPECVREADRGFVPIGTLVAIGQRECRVGCRCRYEFR